MRLPALGDILDEAGHLQWASLTVTFEFGDGVDDARGASVKRAYLKLKVVLGIFFEKVDQRLMDAFALGNTPLYRVGGEKIALCRQAVEPFGLLGTPELLGCSILYSQLPTLPIVSAFA